MIDKLKLMDGTILILQDGVGLHNIQVLVESEEQAIVVCNEITPANVVHVEFYANDNVEPYAIYDDMKIAVPASRTDVEGGVLVQFALVKKDESEIKLEEIEKQMAVFHEEQEMQNDMINYLIMNDMG